MFHQFHQILRGLDAPHTPHCPCPAPARSELFHFFAPRWLQDAFKMSIFFHYFFDIVFNRFLSQLGPNLAPKSTPKSTQEPPKINPKSQYIFDLFFDRFFIDFPSIFDAKINQKSIKNQSQNHPKSISTKNSKHRFCIVIYNTFVPSAMLCCVQNSTKNDTEILSKTTLKSTPNLDRFCTQLGSILGGFWSPRWSQIRLKSLHKSIFKSII